MNGENEYYEQCEKPGLDKSEKLLVDFWNEHLKLYNNTLSKNEYFKNRNEAFNSEIASSVHDIQGRLAIIKLYFSEVK